MPLLEKFSPSDEQIILSIDRGLERVGPNVKYLVYWHLQKIGHVKRTDIIAHPEKFVIGLKGLYRESATGVERAIVQELNASYDMNLQPTQLVNAIKEARQKGDRTKEK